MENIMDRVLYEKVGRVGIISLNMVGDNNRSDPASYHALNEALLKVRDDEDVWAIVLQPAPGKKDFSVGADLNKENFMEIVTQGYGSYLESDMTTPKPIVCAVHGWAIGEGFGFMLACDITIAHPNTKFWLNESQRGLAPVNIPVNLTKKIGYSNAMAFMVPGDKKDINWAVDVGLIARDNVCQPDEDVRDVALAYATRITELCAPMAIQGVKVASWETSNGHEDEAITKALWAKEMTVESKDLQEALDAWKEGRPAVFKNE